jgi:hypothetical protein
MRRVLLTLYLTLLNGIATVVSWATRRPRVESHLVRGFVVVLVNTRPDIASTAVLERFREALDLIAKYQPTRYAHLERDVTAFRISREAHRGAYHWDEGFIVTELTFLARRDIGAAVVASSILHEGVHARIHCFSPAATGRDPAREERICRTAELWFGQSLPSELGEPVIERALESLALSDADIAPRATQAEEQAAIARVDQEVMRGAS